MSQEFYINLYVPTHVSKKNNRPIWRGRLGKSQTLRDMENYLTAAMKQAWGNKPPIRGAVWVKFIFHSVKYFTKAGVRNRKLPDLTNLFHLPSDCLEKAGIIENDTDIVSVDGSRRRPSEQNRLEIWVSAIPE